MEILDHFPDGEDVSWGHTGTWGNYGVPMPRIPKDIEKVTSAVMALGKEDHSRLKWTIAFGIVIGAALTSVASLIALLVLIELSQIG
jgi:hypothetical protein